MLKRISEVEVVGGRWKFWCLLFVDPWGSRWWLGLTVNQFAAGSIPAYGAVARFGVGFQRLIVNELVAGSIPVGHLSDCVAAVFG